MLPYDLSWPALQVTFARGIGHSSAPTGQTIAACPHGRQRFSYITSSSPSITRASAGHAAGQAAQEAHKFLFTLGPWLCELSCLRSMVPLYALKYAESNFIKSLGFDTTRAWIIFAGFIHRSSKMALTRASSATVLESSSSDREKNTLAAL